MTFKDYKGREFEQKQQTNQQWREIIINSFAHEIKGHHECMVNIG